MPAAKITAVVALLLGSLVVALPAWADTIVNQTTPFATSVVNDCTGELVAVEGNLHTIVRMSSSGDRLNTAEAVHFTGVKGTALVSGAQYVEMDVQNTQANMTVDSDFAPSEFTAERTMNLTRLGEDKTFGDGDDLRVHVIAHMTINANGVVTADKFDATAECR